MTWLFTQVWLWSLAAFVSGSLITWLLFVRPLRRRMRALADDYSDYQAYAEDRFDHVRPAGPPVEHSGLDLLPSGAASESHDEPPVGGWDRIPRPWTPARTADPAKPQDDESPPVGLRAEDYPETVTELKPVDDADLRLEEQREAAQAESRWAVTRGEIARADSAQRNSDQRNSDQRNSDQRESPQWEVPRRAGPVDSPRWESTQRGSLSAESTQSIPVPETAPHPRSEDRPVTPPTAPAELSFTPSEAAEPAPDHAEPEVPDNQSSWFEKPNSEGAQQPFGWSAAFDSLETERTGPSASDGAKLDAERTGQLRSLFEPRGGPAARPDDPTVTPDRKAEEPVSATPATPEPTPTPGEPAEARAGEQGAEATQYLPKIDEATGLPRRTPGVGPRPGRQNLNSLRSANDDPQPADPAADSDATDHNGARKTTGTPEATDAPVESAPESSERESQMVKGHFASRQYHTPESPQYDRIVAEVWFRSSADAERAGFEPWDGEQSLN